MPTPGPTSTTGQGGAVLEGRKGRLGPGERAERGGERRDCALVDAGIAASDAICCSRLGEFFQEKDHHQAVAILGRADADCERHLSALLRLKPKAAYSHVPIIEKELKQAARAAEELLSNARRIAGS